MFWNRHAPPGHFDDAVWSNRHAPPSQIALLHFLFSTEKVAEMRHKYRVLCLHAQLSLLKKRQIGNIIAECVPEKAHPACARDGLLTVFVEAAARGAVGCVA